jgi:hypothetical protein
MKQTLVTIALLAATCSGTAETFIGVTSSTNRLVVGTNEALVISKFTYSGSFQLVKDGSVFTTSDGVFPEYRIAADSPSALAGPCELVFPNVALLNFQRISTGSIQTVVLTPSATTNSATVSVPSGRNIRIFRPMPSTLGINASLRVARGTNIVSFYSLSFKANDEFTGPIDVTFSGALSGTTHIYSYALTDEPQVVPQGVTVQSPTGAFQFLVEKSVDLTNWVPSVIQNLQGNQKAYYRLRITK